MLPDAVARCVAAAQRDAPPTLARALSVLGETALYEDACRLEIAPRARDAAMCEAVSEGPLRTSCTARAAMVMASPETCPPALGIHGRDPVCVAIAARSSALCAAAMIHERPICEAIARGEPSPCASLDAVLRPRCVAEAAAMAGLVPVMREGALAEGRATLRTGAVGQDASVDRPLRIVSRGVWMDPSGALWLADPIAGTRVTSSMLDATPALAVQIVAPRTHARLRALARVAMPDTGGPERPGDWTPCEATLRRAPRGRGDRVTGEVTIDTQWHNEPLHLTLEFDSFVRDVIDPTTLDSP